MPAAVAGTKLPPETHVALNSTCRLVPSRYPSVGILDTVTRPEDLELMFELEGWTNDRISTELGILHRLPKHEWVTGHPTSSVIMAAFCHPRPQGSRFNGPDRGAWYAATQIDAAHAEVIYHRTAELAEVGVFETTVQMRLYRADFDALFHDIRPALPEYDPYHDPLSYRASQAFARELFEDGSNGILYRSVRYRGGECLACFRPPLVMNVQSGPYFSYTWTGGTTPKIRLLR